jgi:hypothetical protein
MTTVDGCVSKPLLSTLYLKGLGLLISLVPIEQMHDLNLLWLLFDKNKAFYHSQSVSITYLLANILFLFIDINDSIDATIFQHVLYFTSPN